MQPSIHRQRREQSREDEDTRISLSLISSDVNVDFEEGTNFETSVLCGLQGFLVGLFTQGNEQNEHDQSDKLADTPERSHILMLRDKDLAVGDADQSENFIDTSKQITYGKGVLSISYKALMKILSLPFALFRLPSPVIYKPSRTYNRIMAKLIQLEDNGDFHEFDRYTSAIIKEHEDVDPDIVAAVTVEQARCYTYRGNLRAAKIHARRGLELALRTRFPTKFQARTFTVMATISRKQNKLGSTEKNLGLAEQSFKSGWDLEDMARFHECHGSFLDSLMGSLAQPDKSVKERALDSFKTMSEVALQDTRSRVREKNRFYALIRSARILLDSNSSFGRRVRVVSTDSIALASRHLEVIKNELWKSIPRGSQIQFGLVKSDLYFRQGNFEEERGLLQQCLDEARSYGFKTEVPIILQVYIKSPLPFLIVYPNSLLQKKIMNINKGE